ncbi:MAG: ThiF family adenylyltransferase [Rhodocyclaceae bacterium]|nr:ThiF family adenylyltransferase [Rhodocyclaceae bacterium]
MEPWFIRYSRRLEDELQALGKTGLSFELDEAAKDAGRIVIRLKYPLEGMLYDMEILFPEQYPYFPFEIFCSSFPDGRHKNPNDGRLCLLKNPQQSWRSEDDRLAAFLVNQVPTIAAAHREPDDAEEIEAHEAAQVTGYFPYAPGSSVFTGDWQVPPEYRRGYLLLGISSFPGTHGEPFRAAVLEVQDENRRVLVKIDEKLRKRYSPTSTGRWIRLQSAPPFDPALALADAANVWKDLGTPRFDRAPDVVGFLIPEEVQYGQFAESWVFAVREKVRQQKPHGQAKLMAYFSRADQASESALLARMSNLGPMRTKKVLVVGLGSIGSVYAWQLARAGIGAINMIDFDHLEFGNSSRWLLGWQSSGHDKANLLAHHLGGHYPLSTFRAWCWRIGSPSPTPELSETKVLEEALNGVDLIFDATAEWCVSHFLSDLAQQRRIPYLWATGTPGARGGTIGRIVPGKTNGCWKCYQRHLTDGTILTPNHADLPDVQPVGCFHPTFTGTGFDMDHVTLAAVRLSASTLCLGENGGYPNFTWDVGTVNSWSNDGVPISPEWTTYTLDKHPACEHDVG